MRSPLKPLSVLRGHSYAVRRVQCSPHAPTVLLTCSYDMTLALWDWAAPENALLARYGQHTEFAVGLDMSVHSEGLIASTGWDEMTYVWRAGTDPRAMP